MTSQKVYLVVGANRGIGFGLASAIASTPSNILFATTRDAKSAASTKLVKLSAENKNVHVLSAEVTDVEKLLAAASAIKDLGYSHIDAVIFNAGIMAGNQDLSDITKDRFLEGMEVNAFGPILVHQAFKSFFGEKHGAKTVFATVSSIAGWTVTPMPLGNIAYSTSKAALNHVTAKINLLDDNLIAFAIHPGLVETDMSQAAADTMGGSLDAMSAKFGIELLSPGQSAASMLNLVDASDVTKYAGKFLSYTGEELPL